MDAVATLFEDGRMKFLRGQWGEARSLLYNYIKTNSYDDSVALSQALLMIAKMDYYPLKWIYRSIAESPDNQETWTFLVETMIWSGDTEKARTIAKFARQLGSTHNILNDLDRADTNILDSWKVVIPTKNNVPEMLLRLVSVIGDERVIIVHTVDKTVSPDIAGCTNIRYIGELNIQDWWKTGIEKSESRYIALVNDDVEMVYNIIPRMIWECWRQNKALARIKNSYIPWSGFFFIIDRESGIEPDTRFKWWYGDNDLFKQAETKNGIVDIPVTGVRHKGGYAFQADNKFLEIGESDRIEFHKKWKLP